MKLDNFKKGSAAFLTVFIVVLVALAIGVYYLTNKKNLGDPQQPVLNDTNSQTDSNNTETNPEFTIGITGDLIANINQIKDNNVTMSAQAQYDTTGNWRMQFKTDTGQVDMIYAEGSMYMRNENLEWTKLPNIEGATDMMVDPTLYRFDETWQTKWRENAKFEGTETCADGSGTCNVYTLEEDGAINTLYVNSETNNPVRYTFVDGNQNTEVNYIYDQEVNIEVPEI